MKKIFIPLIFAFLLPISFSCGTAGKLGYNLTESDAASAIRQMLEIGGKQSLTGAFSKETILSTLFPENIRKALNTLQTLGLTPEIDRFTTTLGTAAERAAERSVPVVVNGISRMSLTDAMRIVKSGGTSATDYLRANVGSDLRKSITPVMQQVADEYKLSQQWDKLVSPIKVVFGNKLNLDLSNLMAGLVAEKMFQKMAEQEQLIRTQASARTTPLLQKVFSRDWSK